MSVEEQSRVEDLVAKYCRTMDDRHKNLIKIIWALVIVILGAGAIQFVSFGEVKAQSKSNADKIEFIDKNYIPSIFLEGMQQNYSYQLEEIVAVFTGDKEKVKDISRKYSDFQITMMRQLSQQKGSIPGTTRSIK
jgi:hypothetical protein